MSVGTQSFLVNPLLTRGTTKPFSRSACRSRASRSRWESREWPTLPLHFPYHRRAGHSARQPKEHFNPPFWTRTDFGCDQGPAFDEGEAINAVVGPWESGVTSVEIAFHFLSPFGVLSREVEKEGFHRCGDTWAMILATVRGITGGGMRFKRIKTSRVISSGEASAPSFLPTSFAA
jgi:hypothetical protein